MHERIRAQRNLIMEKLIRGIARTLAVLSAAAIVVMVIAITIDVFVRNTTGASLGGMIEIAETAMVTAVAFGLAWAGVRSEERRVGSEERGVIVWDRPRTAK